MILLMLTVWEGGILESLEVFVPVGPEQDVGVGIEMKPEAEEVGGDAGGDDFDEYFVPGGVVLVVVSEEELLVMGEEEDGVVWGGGVGVVCLQDKGGGDDGHGADTPELDHGEETDEVVELGVVGGGLEDGVDGIDEELDGGRAGGVRLEETDDAVCVVLLEEVVHVTTRSVTRM